MVGEASKMIRHDDSCRTRISGMYSCTCGAYERAQKIHKEEQEEKKGNISTEEIVNEQRRIQQQTEKENYIRKESEKVARTEKEYLLGMRNIYRDECVDQEINEKVASEWEKVYPEFNQNKIGTLESKVDHPSHYNQISIECIDVVEQFNFNKGNAIKYVWRSSFKGNEVEDLEKAAWLIKREMERIKNETQARSGIQDNGSSEAKGNR